VHKQIKHLRAQGNSFTAALELAPITIEDIVFKGEFRRSRPWVGLVFLRLLNNRLKQRHLSPHQARQDQFAEPSDHD
jgi:hypothetical protein